jgi:hypothetical protein
MDAAIDYAEVSGWLVGAREPPQAVAIAREGVRLLEEYALIQPAKRRAAIAERESAQARRLQKSVCQRVRYRERSARRSMVVSKSASRQSISPIACGARRC